MQPTRASLSGDYVGDLISFMDAHDIEVAWVSGQVGGSSPLGACSWVEKLVIPLKWSANTMNRFRLFVRGFDYEDPASVAYVLNRLSLGFRGVGELLVHGYEPEHEYVTGCVLDQIFSVAGTHGAPVLVHWDINGVETRTLGSYSVHERRERNSRQLIQALQGHPQTNFILAHCGAGPAESSGVRTRADDDVFCKRLDGLLASYPNLYLDIAGMWEEVDLEDPHNTLAPLLLALVEKHPTRFLIGVDTGPTLDTAAGHVRMLDPDGDLFSGLGAEDSLAIYRLFLGALSAGSQVLVASGNATALIP